MTQQQDDFIPGTQIRLVRGDFDNPADRAALLTNPTIHTIFWGQSWQNLRCDTDNTSLKQHVLGFLNAFKNEAKVKDTLNLYGDRDQSGQPMPLLPPQPSQKPVHDHGPQGNPPLPLTDDKIQAFIKETVNDFGGNDLYFVFIPPGWDVTVGGFRSCIHFCGYHRTIDGGAAGAIPPISYAVIVFPNCPGCNRGHETEHALTIAASHEFLNAVTDPVHAKGIFDPAHNELADLCLPQVEYFDANGRQYRRRAIMQGVRQPEFVGGVQRDYWTRGPCV
jgi:hypothetical protein